MRVREPVPLPPVSPISRAIFPSSFSKVFCPKNTAPVGMELTFLLGRLIFATTLDITRPLSPALFRYPTPAVSRYWFAPSSSRTLSFLVTSKVTKEFCLPQFGVSISNSSLSQVLAVESSNRKLDTAGIALPGKNSPPCIVFGGSNARVKVLSTTDSDTILLPELEPEVSEAFSIR